MFTAKLRFKLQHLIARIKVNRIDWSKILTDIFFVGVIIALSINIYITFDKGLSTATRFEEEEAKLEVIEAENEVLLEQVKEYESLEYKRIYARDNLNLGHDNETIYFIDREEELPEIELLEEDKFRISFKDKEAYWAELLF